MKHSGLVAVFSLLLLVSCSSSSDITMRSVSSGSSIFTFSKLTSTPSRRAVGGRSTVMWRSEAPELTVACNSVTSIGSGSNISVPFRRGPRDLAC